MDRIPEKQPDKDGSEFPRKLGVSTRPPSAATLRLMEWLAKEGKPIKLYPSDAADKLAAEETR